MKKGIVYLLLSIVFFSSIGWGPNIYCDKTNFNDPLSCFSLWLALGSLSLLLGIIFMILAIKNRKK